MFGPLFSVSWRVSFPKHPGPMGGMGLYPQGSPISAVLAAHPGAALQILRLVIDLMGFSGCGPSCTCGLHDLHLEFLSHSPKPSKGNYYPPLAQTRASRGPFMEYDELHGIRPEFCFIP